MYALVINEQIKVGPRNWSYGMFKLYFDEKKLDETDLPRNDPGGPVISKDWKLLPIIKIDQPNYNGIFEQLSGPYWTIHNDHITGEYIIAEQQPDAVKNIMKNIVSDNRWKYETGNLEVNLNGTTVSLYTTREDRTTYLDALMIIPDDITTYNFKFKNTFKAVNKNELQIIVGTIANHIQTAFDWEKTKHTEIEACGTLEELRNIELLHPSQITP